ncbi:hypothetical protein D9C73_026712 [Collichthys lucidus]|nr:hypothetical protein D9C73_026712 [Collichthys lucidus]
MSSSSSSSSSSFFVDLSSNSSFNPFNECFITRMNIYIFSAFSVTNLLLLPVFISVLYLGLQRWRKQRSTSTASTSHSDIFTYHCVILQLNELFGFVLYFCGSYMDLRDVALTGFCVSSATNLGQALFHVLTCVERYLAVVHPVTYLGLKQTRGVKIRNISIGSFLFSALSGVQDRGARVGTGNGSTNQSRGLSTPS